jgi:hypothetical protein
MTIVGFWLKIDCLRSEGRFERLGLDDVVL